MILKKHMEFCVNPELNKRINNMEGSVNLINLKELFLIHSHFCQKSKKTDDFSLFYKDYKIFNLNKKEVLDKILAYFGFFLGKQYNYLTYDSEHDDDTESIRKIKNLACESEFQYSLDIFDCVTFLESVLALLGINKVNDFYDFEEKFVKNLKRIRYKESKTTFLNRNHFISVDFFKNNEDLTKDLTLPFLNFCKKATNENKMKFNNEFIETKIDKLNWLLKHKTMQNFHLGNDETIKLLNKFEPNHNFFIHDVKLPYIELNWLINNYHLFLDYVPNFFVSYIVRSGWDIKDEIGTNLDISHLGFCFKNVSDNSLKFYHATSIDDKKIVVIDFLVYLKRCLNKSSVKGINISSIESF